jgi:hypothetical protein
MGAGIGRKEPAVGIEPTTGGLRIRGLQFLLNLKLKLWYFSSYDLQFLHQRGAKLKRNYTGIREKFNTIRLVAREAYTFLLAPTDAFPSEQKQESGVPCL